MIRKCEKCRELVYIDSENPMVINCTCGGIYYAYPTDALIFNIYKKLEAYIDYQTARDVKKDTKKRFWKR